MKIDPKLVGRWLCEWAAKPDYYTTDSLVYIAQRAADHALEEAKKLIGHDAYAISFQTLGQYRSALIKELSAMKGTK